LPTKTIITSWAIIEGINDFRRRIMDREELLRRYAAGERDFSGVSLRGLDFSDCNLSGINLSNADLSETEWDGANLSRANLSSAILQSSGLNNANLSRANLTRARLQDSAFIGADLTDASVEGTQFGGEPCLDGANLTGVDLSKASIHLPGGIDNPRIAGAILCDTTLPDGGNWTI
jgi:uncharacterized protein YjbI with pentapeptide repeats